jgi:zinc transport system substrate-binding protein
MNKKFILAALGVVVLVVAISAYFADANAPESDGKVHITATFYPLADFARQVGGDKVTVTNITPTGTEPHDFDPSPRDIIKIRESQVFVYSGSGFEPWADKVVPDLEDPIVVSASKGIELLPATEEHEHEGEEEHEDEEEHEEEHHHDSVNDPHFYLDPVLDQKAVQNIADGLSKADPANKDYYQKNADAYIAELKDLNEEYEAGLETCGSRDIVTSHAAFAYLAKRYDLNQVAISGIAEEEPSAARLAEVAKFVNKHHVKYIFFEELVSPRLSETIARETGAKTMVLNPIEGLTSDQKESGEDFISLMKNNLANLRKALACE